MILTAITSDQAADFKGEKVELRATMRNSDLGPEIIVGELISFNSKGWNVKFGGKTVTRSENTVLSVALINYEGPSEDVENEDIDLNFEEIDLDIPAEAEIVESGDSETEGYTTREVADMFAMSAYDLRKQLRALGLGVGQGKRYGLTDDDVKVIKAALAPSE